MMFEKILNNDLDYLKENIKDINVLDDKKRNLLYYASLNNDSKIFDFLINTNIHVNQVDIYGETVLFDVVRKSKMKYAKELIKNYVNVNIQNRKGESALHLACEKGNLEMIKLLVENKALLYLKTSDDKHIIHYAILSGEIEVIKYVLSITNENIFVLDEYQNTLLHHAAKTTNIFLINWLLEQGLNPNLQNDMFETAIFNAIRFSTREVCYKLLEHGSYLNIYNRRYETPIDISLIFEKDDLYNDLIEYINHPKYLKLIDEQKLTIAVLNRDVTELKKLIIDDEPLRKDKFLLTAIDYARINRFQIGVNILNESRMLDE